MVDIVYDVLITKLTHKDAARKYRITEWLVGFLLKKFKTNKCFI